MFKTFAVGNLVSDAKVYVNEKTGNKCLNFRMAFSQYGIRPSEQDIAAGRNSGSVFVNCHLWNTKNGSDRAAALVNTMKKGQQLYVEGVVTPNSYTNNEGKTVVDLDMLVNEFTYCGSPKVARPGDPAPAANQPQQAAPAAAPANDEFDMPF